MERRRYERILDEVYLEYLVVNEDSIPDAVREFLDEPTQHFNPLNQLQAIAIRSQTILGKIREIHPLIGEYLISIDERIQLLCHAVAQDQVGVPINPNENVNLSAGGISFSSDDAIATNSVLEFSIIVIPAYLHISALGKVVYCRANNTETEGPFRIGVEFTHIHEADRQSLSNHIAHKQLY